MVKVKPQVNPAVFAKEVVLAHLERRPLPEPPNEDFYRRRAACFVSIKKEGELRGCIGTLQPNEINLGQELMRNAASAAFHDPRFAAVALDEFPALSFSVDVLSQPETVQAHEELDCKKYGVIVGCDYRRGVLLPDLDGVESVEDQLAIACQKAGIFPEEKFSVQRFSVTRYGEEGEFSK